MNLINCIYHVFIMYLPVLVLWKLRIAYMTDWYKVAFIDGPCGEHLNRGKTLDVWFVNLNCSFCLSKILQSTNERWWDSASRRSRRILSWITLLNSLCSYNAIAKVSTLFSMLSVCILLRSWLSSLLNLQRYPIRCKVADLVVHI